MGTPGEIALRVRRYFLLYLFFFLGPGINCWWMVQVKPFLELFGSLHSDMVSQRVGSFYFSFKWL